MLDGAKALQKFLKSSNSECFRNNLGLADLVNVTGEVEHLAGEAPLVVVPSDQLDEVPKMPNIGIFGRF